MASTPDMPPRPRTERENEDENRRSHQDDTEPLLGRPGDASQHEANSPVYNLVLGTGIIAQIGIVVLFVVVWASVLTKPVIIFSGHPLANSLAALTLVQSVLYLQPTHTAEQKEAGQRVHASLNLLALLFLTAGVVFVLWNKIATHSPHFHSVHAYFGIVTIGFMLVQYFVGFTMWATPALYGGEDKAKSLYKFHRYSGYLILVLLLVTVNLATQTDYNKDVLKIKLWATFLLSLVVVVGVLPRIQKQKLGLGRRAISL